MDIIAVYTDGRLKGAYSDGETYQYLIMIFQPLIPRATNSHCERGDNVIYLYGEKIFDAR